MSRSVDRQFYLDEPIAVKHMITGCDDFRDIPQKLNSFMVEIENRLFRDKDILTKDKIASVVKEAKKHHLPVITIDGEEYYISPCPKTKT